MRKISYVLIAGLLFSACSQPFKKGDMGLEYKIISTGSGNKIKLGEFMQIQLGQYYNNGKTDSLMNDTRNTSGPLTELLDTVSTPPAYYKIISQLKKGDSLVIRTLTDSAFAKYPEQMPAFFKKGHYLITTVKLLNIFSSREAADSARLAETELKKKRDSISSIATLAKDDKTLNDYFAKNKITVQKAPLGTYVEIIQPGTGPLIDTSVVVKTNYTGRTMDGKMFDSNTDPSKNHVEPFNVNMTNDYSLGGGVIKGWTDGMKLLNKGAKAKFYIPSTLAYGAQQAGPDIAPNSILVFDIEVLDVLSRETASAEAAAKMREMKEKQKKFRDSLAANRAKTDSIKK